MSLTLDTDSLDDSAVTDFVATVRGICESAPTADGWSPTGPADDRNTVLRERLTEAGWFEITSEPYAADILGPAAIELGRALASLDLIDDLLGHGVALGADVVGDIALGRYRTVGQTVWLCGADGAHLAHVITAQPVSYVDAQAVSVITTEPVTTTERTSPNTVSGNAVDAWTAAMTGYVAGLATGALELARGHVEQRIAFGKPLAAQDAVAKKVADCATATEGLWMAAHHTPDGFVLQQAPVAAFRVARACHQMLGGLGFTLEYPLQRYSRRIEALRAWTPAVVTALEASR